MLTGSIGGVTSLTGRPTTCVSESTYCDPRIPNMKSRATVDISRPSTLLQRTGQTPRSPGFTVYEGVLHDRQRGCVNTVIPRVLQSVMKPGSLGRFHSAFHPS
jgi:hypothetical protein